MSIILNNQKISYYDAPKCACTSIKMMLFSIENGFRFKDFTVNNRIFHIHEVCPTLLFEWLLSMDQDDHFKFTVVRNPIKRFMSFYANRIVDHNDLAYDIGKKEMENGLKPQPTASEFIERFHDYRACSPNISHHTDPLVVFIGKKPSFYSRIYNTSQLEKMKSDIEEIVGAPLELPHEQSSPIIMQEGQLSANDVDFLTNFYEADFEAYSEFF